MIDIRKLISRVLQFTAVIAAILGFYEFVIIDDALGALYCAVYILAAGVLHNWLNPNNNYRWK